MCVEALGPDRSFPKEATEKKATSRKARKTLRTSQKGAKSVNEAVALIAAITATATVDADLAETINGSKATSTHPVLTADLEVSLD